MRFAVRLAYVHMYLVSAGMLYNNLRYGFPLMESPHMTTKIHSTLKDVNLNERNLKEFLPASMFPGTNF